MQPAATSRDFHTKSDHHEFSGESAYYRTEPLSDKRTHNNQFKTFAVSASVSSRSSTMLQHADPSCSEEGMEASDSKIHNLLAYLDKEEKEQLRPRKGRYIDTGSKK